MPQRKVSWLTASNSCYAGAAYAVKKAELAEERKRREAEREAAREARRQAMRDYMEHNFLQVRSWATSLACILFCITHPTPFCIKV